MSLWETLVFVHFYFKKGNETYRRKKNLHLLAESFPDFTRLGFETAENIMRWHTSARSTHFSFFCASWGDTVEKISYFNAIHCIHLFMVIFWPLLKYFWGDLKTLRDTMTCKKYFCMHALKWKKFFFLSSSKHDSGGKLKLNL